MSESPLPLWRRQRLTIEIRRQAALALLELPGVDPAARLRALESVQAHCPIPEQ